LNLKHLTLLLLTCIAVTTSGGCATIRVTDPPRTATEQYLIRQAAMQSIAQLSLDSLRDRSVYLETTYLSAVENPSTDVSFLLGELRAKILTVGARLSDKREDAQIVMEVRSPGLGIDRVEFLLGIPALYLSGAANSTGNVPVAIPELAILKSTKQYGYASVAFVAYWKDTGEMVYQSGPFVGRTNREDWWFFGLGPKTTGNIPTTEKPR
jgi:hypothetical protein